MRRKILQDLANTLCQMVVGWRMGDDFEQIASLPDGTLNFNVLAGTVSHSSEGAQQLWVAGELSAWFKDRMRAENIDASGLITATLEAKYKTDRIKTARKRLVSFDFECHSVLTTDERQYEGKLVERHVYHERLKA